MSPERVFQVLAAAGLISGGWLYGDYQMKMASAQAEGDRLAELRAQNTELTNQVSDLEDKLAEVRSVLASGPFPIPSELTAWIEKDYNMAFLKAPEVRLASPDELTAAARSNLRLTRGELTLEKESLAWALLGLLPPNQRLFPQLAVVQSKGLKGVFDMADGTILLAEDFDPVSLEDRSVLVRLLGQLISWQNHPRKLWRDRDEWQAWEAVHVGAAASSQSRFQDRNQVKNDEGWRDPEPQRSQLLNALPAAIQGFSNFPFLAGTDFARINYIDSRNAWAEMFQAPPRTTHEILHPAQKTPSTNAPSFFQASSVTITIDSLGELGLRLWLEPLTGMDEADALSSEWVADQYELRNVGEGAQEIEWIIELRSEKAARSLAAEVERSVLRPITDAQEGRTLTVTAEGKLVRFLNSPSH